MNPFKKHGIGHLSPSSLNLYIAQPGIWALRYLARRKEAGNVKMWRGTAVEAGYVAYLRTSNPEEAYDVAMRSYRLNVAENNAGSESADEEAKLIEPMLAQCLLWTPPSDINASQIKVKHYFDGVPVPVMGYVDLSFEGLDVDLKTTTRCPSKPSADHVRQVSLYRVARNKPGALLYVTDKRRAYFEVTDEMMAPALEELAGAARKVTRLLTAFKDAEEVLSVLPIDMSDFRAPKETAARATTPAAEEFEVVDLQT